MNKIATATILLSIGFTVFIWPEFDGVFNWGVPLSPSEGRILSGVYFTGAILALTKA